MKLTLFTISNEQIKEQLSKLQTKVESLETVKDVQDKIISTKDSQISFLNDQIANIWASVSIVVAFIGVIASAVFAYVAWLNKQGVKIVKEGEEQIEIANQKIKKAESTLQEIETAKEHTKNNLTASDKKIEKLNLLIDKSNNIAIIAQKKLDALEEWQEASAILSNINFLLDFIENNLKDSREEIYEPHLKTPEEQLVLLNHFTNKYNFLRAGYSSILSKINQSVKQELHTSDLEYLKQLEESANKLHTDIIDNLYEQD